MGYSKYIFIPGNSFGQNFCRRQKIAEFTPETCKNAGILKKRRRIQKMPDLQMSVEATEMQKIYPLAITPELRGITPELRAITPELWAITPAGIMNNYFKKSANQNCRRGLKNAGKHQKAPFTRQSRLFAKRQK